MHYLSDKGVAREMSSDSSIASLFKIETSLRKRKNLLPEVGANYFVKEQSLMIWGSTIATLGY